MDTKFLFMKVPGRSSIEVLKKCVLVYILSYRFSEIMQTKFALRSTSWDISMSWNKQIYFTCCRATYECLYS